MFEDFELAIPSEILESLEDMAGEVLELKSLVLSLALHASELPTQLPSGPIESSH